jgi:hypoxanthine phosphoribosyltransferase
MTLSVLLVFYHLHTVYSLQYKYWYDVNVQQPTKDIRVAFYLARSSAVSVVDETFDPRQSAALLFLGRFVANADRQDVRIVFDGSCA